MRAFFLSAARALGIVGLLLGAPPAVTAQDAPMFEFSAGYQLIGVKGDVDETLGKGWYADLAGNISGRVAAVFEAGGSYKTLRETVTEQGVTLTAKGDFRLHQFMGGLRVKGPSRAVTPFAQFLAGGVHLTGNASGTFDGLSFDVSHSATDFVTQIGGGVTFGLSERVRMRAAGDYLRIFEEDAGVNAFRFAVGAVFPF